MLAQLCPQPRNAAINLSGGVMTQRSAFARRPLAAALFVALIAPGMAFAQTAKEKALEARVDALEKTRSGS